jgi:methylphosphotriester-DNA--protein-cysteine methyltransferase
MKKRLSIMLTAILLLGSMLAVTLSYDNTALAATYVGASTTGKFHYESCRWAQKIRDDHRVYFESREEAIDAGYVPCKVCRP